MSTAKGTVVSLNGSKFIATFIVDEIHGVSITGDLPDSNQVEPASTVDGSGTWTTT
ncbi:hypothetical protein FA13DRAFT_1798305 [Coprinellus micaceus]|uniref:Uncharacterized protein n=1 Tax=Coprinellus micaceus TaxID=71717 RepID=A0A4Y7SME1_COPMI|nr:hypothetical protein FA13DRAFT_1798305 [Coprinellus micaceus]